MAVYIPEKHYYSTMFVDLLCARYRGSEGYKMNKPVELEEHMNQGENET